MSHGGGGVWESGSNKQDGMTGARWQTPRPINDSSGRPTSCQQWLGFAQTRGKKTIIQTLWCITQGKLFGKAMATFENVL